MFVNSHLRPCSLMASKAWKSQRFARHQCSSGVLHSGTGLMFAAKILGFEEVNFSWNQRRGRPAIRYTFAG
jgi:hypothetical protein